MTAEIVPFGKYKGAPVEVLAADRDYCEWLTAQPWFADKYRNVYNVVINYGSEPQDSPEHNQMQARFLNDQWCLALANLLYPYQPYGRAAAKKQFDADPICQKFLECVEFEQLPPKPIGRGFEVDGWDVVYTVDAAGIEVKRTSLVPPLPACSCRCDHTDCLETAVCHGGKRWCRHASCANRSIEKYSHCNDACYWRDGGGLTENHRSWLMQGGHYYAGSSPTIYVELKPDLGDDYPSVLRQVKGYKIYGSSNRRCMVARRCSFQHVTWENVQQIFAASGIYLVTEDCINLT